MNSFTQLVEKIKKLSLDEKEELHLLLGKYLVEARRDEIHTHFEESKAAYKAGKTKFSAGIKDLKKNIQE